MRQGWCIGLRLPVQLRANNHELKNTGPSTYTPSKPKKEYQTYESSGSSSSYNDGYNSAIDDGDYDHDRYRTDPSYRQGVDDGFDETDEDY